MSSDLAKRLGLSWNFYCDASWVRFRHWLLHWKRTPPLFSERNGYTKFYQIPLTDWRIRLERKRTN